MFNYLYDKLSDKVGEDCAMFILEMSGFVEITFKPKIIKDKETCDHYRSYVCYMYKVDDRLRSLTDKYNFLIDNKEDRSNPYWIHINEYDTIESVQKRMRNIIFSHNIKVYYLEDVIYDGVLHKMQIPIGKVFKKKTIFKNNKRIQYLDFTKYEDEYYLVLNFVDKVLESKITYNYERIFY